MIKSARLFLLALITSLGLVFVGLTPALAADPCSGTDAQSALECGAGGGNAPDTAQATKSVNNTFATIINLFSVVAGILSVIMIILAGFRYITSSGAQDKLTSAKHTLTYAIIGLIIVALAQVISQFVLGRATNATKSSSLNTSFIREA